MVVLPVKLDKVVIDLVGLENISPGILTLVSARGKVVSTSRKEVCVQETNSNRHTKDSWINDDFMIQWIRCGCRLYAIAVGLVEIE